MDRPTLSPSCTRSRSTCATEPTPHSLPQATIRSPLPNSLQRRTRRAVGGTRSVVGARRRAIRRAEDRSTVTCGGTRSLRRRESAVEGAWTASTGQRRPSPRRCGKTRPTDPPKPVLLPLPLPLPTPLPALTPDPKAPTSHRGARPTRVVPSLGATRASRERPHRLSCRHSRAGIVRPPTRSPRLVRTGTSLKLPSRPRTRSGRE